MSHSWKTCCKTRRNLDGDLIHGRLLCGTRRKLDGYLILGRLLCGRRCRCRNSAFAGLPPFCSGLGGLDGEDARMIWGSQQLGRDTLNIPQPGHAIVIVVLVGGNKRREMVRRNDSVVVLLVQSPSFGEVGAGCLYLGAWYFVR